MNRKNTICIVATLFVIKSVLIMPLIAVLPLRYCD